MIRNYGADFHFLFISELTLGNGTTRKRGSFHCKYSFRRIFARVWSVKWINEAYERFQNVFQIAPNLFAETLRDYNIVEGK